MKSELNLKKFSELARVFRKEILETIYLSGSGHPGGSLSGVEILISLYYGRMKHKPEQPNWRERDRFILSKGHACPAVYVTLANCGYFPVEELKTFRKLNSLLQGHIYQGVPGVEFSTGSLGHGLSVANGIALGGRLKKADFKVYCLLGDGEIQEGSVWEAAMSAGFHKLDKLCAILDYNGVQQNGPVCRIKDEEPLADKWRAFGFHALEVDGHDFKDLDSAFLEFERQKGKPTIIIAHTIKGQGVSFMEGQSKWHGKAPNKTELEQALKELGF